MAKHLISSTRTIEAMKADKHRLSDGDGLYIKQTPSGKKHWYQDYTLNGKRNQISLGAYPVIGLAEARQRSLEVRWQVAHGIDPAEARRTAKQVHVAINHPRSVKSVAEAWFAIQSASWSSGYADSIQSRLNAQVYPSLGNRVIETVTTNDVTTLISHIRDAGTLETAGRVLSICRRIFDYAAAMGHIKTNPCNPVKEVLPAAARKHHAAFTTPFQLKRLLEAIPKFGGTFVVLCAMKMVLFTFLRSSELRCAKWEEIDLDNRLWLVPASRMKGKKERKLNGAPHYVPLSTQAVGLLRQLQLITGSTGYVFAGQGRKNPFISENTINKALRSLGISTRDEHTTHGFRATARTMLVEQLNIRESIAELQIDHVVRDANGKAYNRTRMLKQRIEMMQLWADYLDWLATQPANMLESLHDDSAATSLFASQNEDGSVNPLISLLRPQWFVASNQVGNKSALTT